MIAILLEIRVLPRGYFRPNRLGNVGGQVFPNYGRGWRENWQVQDDMHIHSRVHEIHFFGKWGGGGEIDNLAASFWTLNQNILKTPEMKSLLSALNR